jgi:hypothetical protein
MGWISRLGETLGDSLFDDDLARVKTVSSKAGSQKMEEKMQEIQNIERDVLLLNFRRREGQGPKARWKVKMSSQVRGPRPWVWAATTWRTQPTGPWLYLGYSMLMLNQSYLNRALVKSLHAVSLS